MLQYKIVHHVRGRIRLEVPVLKKIPPSRWLKLQELPPDLISTGITDVKANPVTGSLIIHYDPNSIDIMGYLEKLSSNQILLDLIGEGK